MDFTSEIQTIPHKPESVYAMLSDLSRLERVRERLPQDTVKDFTVSANRLSVEVNPVGKIEFEVVERIPAETVKFATVQSVVPLTLWIQLKADGESATKMKMTLRADVNLMLRSVVSKPVQEALNRISGLIAALPYE
jgi:carbon monoxide dehydrogenase subunit G